MHELPLIATIAAGFTAAWVLGLLTQWMRLSPIVGYLLAGVLIGPHTPGFVGDLHLAHELAEIGVILLMFGVGLHFHLKDLLAVRAIAIPGALGQSVVATLASVGLFHLLGLEARAGLVIGMALAVASTVVLMRVLIDANALHSPAGHVAVGWLLVEDVLTVIVLVLIPVLGTGGGAGAVAGGGVVLPVLIALGKLVALVLVVFTVGARVIPRVLVMVARLRSRELFTLTVLVFSVAVAAGAYAVFGASMALGAFLAGMVVAQSPVSHQAAADALPLRDAFAVLFFVSVGMLFDPMFLVREPLLMLAALAVILVVKPLIALLLVAALGHSARTALTVAVGLAQVGEFSFILSELARKHGLMPDSGHNLLVGGAILSITLNPFLFRSLDRMEAALRRCPRLWRWLNTRAERRVAGINAEAAAAIAGEADSPRLAVVVGYGPVGRTVDRLLRESGMSTVVIDLNMDTVRELEREGRRAIFGDAAHGEILEMAGIRRASHLLLTLPHSTDRAGLVTTARHLNAGLKIFVRARYLRERGELEQVGATTAIFEEGEAAVALARLVLADTGARSRAIERSLHDIRIRLIEDEYPRHPALALEGVVWTDAPLLDLAAGTAEEAIREMASRIPPGRCPDGQDIAELALGREREWPTSVGHGVAIPHARCPGLATPLVVFGRSRGGLVFDPREPGRAHLVFLLVSPAEQPELQVLLLSRIAAAAGDADRRERLRTEPEPGAIAVLLAEAFRAGRGH